MAQIGKFEKTVQDNSGNPLSGISVTIYAQGAELSTASGNSYTVYDPGALTTAYVVQADTNSATQKQVTSVAATSVGVASPGLGFLAGGTRLVAVTPAPTLYSDATATSPLASNTLTTDANGYCSCWLLGGAYDVIISGTGYSTRLLTDVIISGERRGSNAFDGPTKPGWVFGLNRTGSTNSPIMEWHNPYGTRKAYVTPTGGFVGATISTTGSIVSGTTIESTGAMFADTSLTVGTSASVGTTLSCGAFTGNSTGSFAGLLTASAGLTGIGTITMPVNSFSKTYTADGTADQTLTAAAAYADITGASITFTPASSTSEIIVMAFCPVASSAAANAFFQIADGANAALAEGETNFGNANTGCVGALVYRVTGLTGSQTFKVRGKCTTANCTVNNSTNAAAKQVTRIIAIEHKF